MGHVSSKLARAGDWICMPNGDRYLVVSTQSLMVLFTGSNTGLCVDLKNPRTLIRYTHYSTPEKVWVSEKGEGMWTHHQNIDEVCDALEIMMRAQSVDNDPCRNAYVALYSVIRKLKKGEIEKGLDDLNDFFNAHKS